MTSYNSSYQSLNPLVNQLQLINKQLEPNSPSAIAVRARIAALKTIMSTPGSATTPNVNPLLSSLVNTVLKKKDLKVPLKNGPVAQLDSINKNLKMIMANLEPTSEQYQAIKTRMAKLKEMRPFELNREKGIANYANNPANLNAKEVRSILSGLQTSQKEYEDPAIQAKWDQVDRLVGFSPIATKDPSKSKYWDRDVSNPALYLSSPKVGLLRSELKSLTPNSSRYKAIQSDLKTAETEERQLNSYTQNSKNPNAEKVRDKFLEISISNMGADSEGAKQNWKDLYNLLPKNWNSDLYLNSTKKAVKTSDLNLLS